MEAEDSPRLAFLRDLAEEEDLDFFAPSLRRFEPLRVSPEKICSQAAAVTQTLQQILHPAPHYRHWGVND